MGKVTLELQALSEGDKKNLEHLLNFMSEAENITDIEANPIGQGGYSLSFEKKVADDVWRADLSKIDEANTKESTEKRTSHLHALAPCGRVHNLLAQNNSGILLEVARLCGLSEYYVEYKKGKYQEAMHTKKRMAARSFGDRFPAHYRDYIYDKKLGIWQDARLAMINNHWEDLITHVHRLSEFQDLYTSQKASHSGEMEHLVSRGGGGTQLPSLTSALSFQEINLNRGIASEGPASSYTSRSASAFVKPHGTTDDQAVASKDKQERRKQERAAFKEKVAEMKRSNPDVNTALAMKTRRRVGYLFYALNSATAEGGTQSEFRGLYVSLYSALQELCEVEPDLEIEKLLQDGEKQSSNDTKINGMRETVEAWVASRFVDPVTTPRSLGQLRGEISRSAPDLFSSGEKRALYSAIDLVSYAKHVRDALEKKKTSLEEEALEESADLENNATSSLAWKKAEKLGKFLSKMKGEEGKRYVFSGDYVQKLSKLQKSDLLNTYRPSHRNPFTPLKDFKRGLYERGWLKTESRQIVENALAHMPAERADRGGSRIQIKRR